VILFVSVVQLVGVFAQRGFQHEEMGLHPCLKLLKSYLAAPHHQVVLALVEAMDDAR